MEPTELEKIDEGQKEEKINNLSFYSKQNMNPDPNESRETHIFFQVKMVINLNIFICKSIIVVIMF